MIYDIAGLRIDIKNAYPFTDRFCAAYLSSDQTSPADIISVVSEEDLAAEREVSPGFSEGYIENICLYRSICSQMPSLNRMLMHCSVLEYDGSGYAFLGRSGTGKSTHTRLWLGLLTPTRVINGDKPILEYKEGEFTAYGTPWMGKEGWGTNASVPLKGLCFLEQAKVNSIERLSPQQAASRLFLQVLMPYKEEEASATLALMDKMVTQVPCYLLKCDISAEAVKTSFEAMTGLSFEEKKNKNEE